VFGNGATGVEKKDLAHNILKTKPVLKGCLLFYDYF